MVLLCASSLRDFCMANSEITENNPSGEAPALPSVITPIQTAIPVFIGYTTQCGNAANVVTTRLINGIEVSEPVQVNSLEEYEVFFGKSPEEPLEILLEEVAETEARSSQIKIRKINCQVSPVRKLYYHLQIFFANGGGSCFVISTGSAAASRVEVNHLLAGIEMAERQDKITLLVCPQTEQLSPAEASLVYQAMLNQAGKLKDRFAILDCFDNHHPFEIKQAVGNHFLEYGAAYHPYLKTRLPVIFSNSSFQISFLNQIPAKTDTDFLLPEELKNEIYAAVKKMTVTLPPSAALAGVYVHNDATRNVWTAPADTVLSQVETPVVLLDEKDQASHIADYTTGKSINVIRLIPHKGSVVIGARTLLGNSRQWKFISMRRSTTMIECSIRRALQPFAWQPNNGATWVRIQLLIENFLQMLWHRNVLQGATPDHAFFVRIGLGETMTQQDIDEKKMIIEIGLALTFPTDYLPLRFELEMKKLS